MKQQSQVIFERNSVEFVTVAAEFCAFIERSEGQKRSEFVDTLLKILPLLYIKASMLPECEVMGEDGLEAFVTEDDYADWTDLTIEQMYDKLREMKNKIKLDPNMVMGRLVNPSIFVGEGGKIYGV